ncbi:unnamed protein product [Ectocarpus sp. 12 AP-2014]
MMAFRAFALLLAGLATRMNALSPRPTILHGPVGADLRLVATSRRSAFNHIKKCQLQQLDQNAPAHICNELDVARELLRDPTKREFRAAFLAPRLSSQNLFTIVYCVRERRPSVYTLEAVVREPGYDVRSSDLQHVVRQHVTNNRGFLQSYPLKTWARGKYAKESYLEDLLP